LFTSLDRRCCLTDQVQGEEYEPEVENCFTDSPPFTLSDKIEQAAGYYADREKRRYLPDDKLHGNRCPDVCAEHYRETIVKANQAGTHHADDKGRGGGTALKQDCRNNACYETVERRSNRVPDILSHAVWKALRSQTKK
jgi:hypothetical protein